MGIKNKAIGLVWVIRFASPARYVRIWPPAFAERYSRMRG